MPGKLLRKRVVAERTGFASRTIDNERCLKKAGLPHSPIADLPWVKVGRSLLLREEDLEAYINGLVPEDTQAEVSAE